VTPRISRCVSAGKSLVKFRCVTILAILFLSACGDSDAADMDAEIRALIVTHELTGNPARGLDLPGTEEPLAVLGRKLFFSKSLGGDDDAACVSCHHPMLGGGDDLPLSIGVGADEPDLLGPGRSHPDGDFTVPRNAPSTFNIALFQKGLFWDARVEKLPGSDGIRTPDSELGIADPEAGETLAAAQSRFPVTSAAEMRGFDYMMDGSNAELRAALEQRLQNDGHWAAEFAAAFGDEEISYGRIAEAIGTYERSQVFVDNPWRAYVEGDASAIGESAKRGALLFFRRTEEGGMACVGCHRGDFFTDEDFRSVGAPQIGRGKGDGPTESHDYGRERETGDPNDRFAFRTPSLLNVAVTGPYFHSGAYEELSDVVRHHLNPRAALQSFDGAGLPPAVVEDLEANTAELLQFLPDAPRTIESFTDPLDYDQQDIEDLVAFLRALTDPCVLDRSCLGPWIADPASDDVDGGLLVAIDRDGNLL
jgi:cytochrome c peroxidase